MYYLMGELKAHGLSLQECLYVLELVTTINTVLEMQSYAAHALWSVVCPAPSHILVL